MMRYYTCITCKNKEKFYFSGFTQTDGMCQDKFIKYVQSRLTKDPKDEIISSLIKSKESGIDTLRVLKSDEEKMKRNEENMKDIEYNITLSERLSTGFNSITGTMFNYFSRGPTVVGSNSDVSKKSTTHTSTVSVEAQKELDMISSLLDQVKEVSLEISDSLDRSNESMSKLNKQVDQTTDRMRRTNTKLVQLNNQQ